MTTENASWLIPEVAGIDHDSLLAAHGVVKDRLDADTLAALGRLMVERVDGDES